MSSEPTTAPHCSLRSESDMTFNVWTNWKRSRTEKSDRTRFEEGFARWLPSPLTKSQVAAAVSRWPETLVVAGAGSGKTTLLLGRAKYLVESGRVQPGRILALAFNRSAAEELTERALRADVDIRAMTFHSFGNSVLNQDARVGGVAFGEEQEVAKFFTNQISASISLDPKRLLTRFFSEMLVPFREQSTFVTMADYAAFARAIPLTLSNTRVKSHGEFVIANYLFARGIRFEYEAIYEGKGRDQWHRPDFTVFGPRDSIIYVEYFGIDAEGNTAPFIDRDQYHLDMQRKRLTHLENETTLVELTYQDLRDGVLVKRLEKELNEREFSTEWKTGDELLAAANDVGYVNRFVRLCGSFLTHARARRITSSQLASMSTADQRTKMFISIFAPFLAAYEAELSRLALPDFADMIHQAADKLISGQVDFPFDHVLVDEYQDISTDRSRLLEAMKTANPSAEFLFVGDDWQSINRFAGADVALMRRFKHKSIDQKTARLAETHRFPQSLADVSSAFIQKNPHQIRKTVVSTNASLSRETLHVHTDTNSSNRLSGIKRVVDLIGEANDGQATLLVIARYNSNLPQRSDIQRFWRGPLDIRSIHRSKGSEADYVIVVDLVQDFRGFPSTIEDDPILALVMPDAETFLYAEERRLMYVALTRARVECHLIAPLDEPSLFAVELIGNYQETAHGFSKLDMSRCPVCTSGFLTQSARDGGTHCSNSPYCVFRAPKCEICRDQRLHSTSVGPMRFSCVNHPNHTFSTCPLCGWGILVKRRGKYGEFKGCSNFSVTGCKGKVSGHRPYQARRRYHQ